MATNLSLKNQLKARGIIAKGIVNSEAAVRTDYKLKAVEDVAVSREIVHDTVGAKAAGPAFRLGYKAYMQLALKTGMYKTLNVMEVFNGQLKFWDPVTEQLIIDPEGKSSNAVIGYAGYFELFNGFKKCVYFTRSSLKNRKKRRTDHDNNYKKIVLREMLLKWGILSTDTQQAYVPELHEEVLLYKPLLKEEDVYNLAAEESGSNVG